jgi:hypothetical protein
MIRIKAHRDFAAGLMFILIALFFLWFGRKLPVGTSVFMESGYFPRLAGVALALLGLWIVISSLRVEGSRLEPWAWRPLLTLSGAVAGFGLIIPYGGLVVTTVVVVIASIAAGFHLRLREALGLAVVLNILMVGLFHYGLNLPVPVWPQW